jgi:hypothetical protein
MTAGANIASASKPFGNGTLVAVLVQLNVPVKLRIKLNAEIGTL